ncbi:hypothetical protein ACH5RR_022429 [Cinchona calisaya]|uniref:Glycosyltransferase n=1 Tax=Cinchona calisaya TaxID=153742 RepID=A0ABD2ZAY8_9GENT
MDSTSDTEHQQQPHAVCLPFPSQGHINPMLKLAILLHQRGFHITFVNTEYNHRRLLKARGPKSLDGFQGFQFKTIPDGLSTSTDDKNNATQDIPSLCDSTRKHCLGPLKELIKKLKDPAVTCIICDAIMSFALEAAEEIGVPGVVFRTANACSLMCFRHVGHLVEKGLVPLKDASYLKNGYLDTTIDWLPGMPEIRLRDFPSFIRTTDPNNIMLSFAITEPAKASKAKAIIINTFDSLEFDVLRALSTSWPPIYTIGPLQLLINQQLPQNSNYESIGSNMWKEEAECIKWLNEKEANSVLYVNFGSIAVLNADQLGEFAWGLAKSKKSFLWIIRPDLVVGDSTVLPREFVEETKERGLIAGWCPQEQVLKHPSTGGFLTHCGWNSILESLCCGVPMICWPFFADQLINCRYACVEWGVGMEVNVNVERNEVENVVRELMDGEKGVAMRRKAMEWKRKAEEATGLDGSSFLNFNRIVNAVLLSKA